MHAYLALLDGIQQGLTIVVLAVFIYATLKGMKVTEKLSPEAQALVELGQDFDKAMNTCNIAIIIDVAHPDGVFVRYQGLVSQAELNGLILKMGGVHKNATSTSDL